MPFELKNNHSDLADYVSDVVKIFACSVQIADANSSGLAQASRNVTQRAAAPFILGRASECFITVSPVQQKPTPASVFKNALKHILVWR